MTDRSENLKEILQIMPADNWFAIYKDADNKLEVPLVAWALVRDEHGETIVVGLDATEFVEFSEDASNFEGYAKLPRDAIS